MGFFKNYGVYLGTIFCVFDIIIMWCLSTNKVVSSLFNLSQGTGNIAAYWAW